MEMEIQHPRAHQQAEGHQKHAGEGRQGSGQSAKAGPHIDGQIDLIGAGEQAGHGETREEGVVAHPAALLHQNPLTPDREAAAKGGQGHPQQACEELPQGGRR